MNKFIEKNFKLILLILVFLMFLKGCNNSHKLNQIKKEITEVKDSTYTKNELNKIIIIEGLKTEKRMIQSTDRKILDVNRQSEIDKEIKVLEGKSL
jgi:ABC-type uncharacterized transport system auxiliary subunit